jgi:Chromo (CHRromatin Organisation MOdifier) domain
MKKLDHKRLGPFKIKSKVSNNAYQLELPHSMRLLHPVFHVSLLTLHRPNMIQNRTQSPLPPIEIDGQIEYQVEAILDSKRIRNKVKYLVRWTGYENTGKAETWEPIEHLHNCQNLLEEFHRRYPRKPRTQFN